MERKIIIGLDKSPQGNDALDLGALLAEAIGATPYIAASLPVALTVLPAEDVKAILREGTEPLFASATERLAHLHPQTIAASSRSPGEFLTLMAEDEEARMIVIGSAGHGMLGRIFPGSVGQNLLHGAPCAVAVAPRGYAEQPSRRLHRLGVAFDGSEEGWTALKTAIGLAKRLRATLRVITVAELMRVGYGDAYSALSAGESYSISQKQHAEMLERGVTAVPKDLPVQTQLLNGEAGRMIAASCEDLDLMVIGSRGYGPVRRTILGSASSRVIRNAACPVLVLPRAAGSDPLGLEEKPAEMAASGVGNDG